MNSEFEDFLRQESAEPPPPSSTLLARVTEDLHPSAQRIAVKLSFCHGVSALIVILGCPQVGVGLGSGFLHHEMMWPFLHEFGSLACAALCGCLFLGTTATLSVLVLGRDELRVANRHGFLNLTAIASVTLAALITVGGAEADRGEYLSWILGALGGGSFVWKLGTFVRLRRLPLLPT